MNEQRPNTGFDKPPVGEPPFPPEDAITQLPGLMSTPATAQLPTLGAPRVPGFEMMHRIGAGGMGVVYKARQTRLERIVALKLIRSGLEASSDEIARFQIEAQAAARLQHPNVVQVYEVGEFHGQPYLCMEYVDGNPLSDELDGTPWPPQFAAKLVETLAWAIQAAHNENIVHRDLKPGNILLTGKRSPDDSLASGSVSLLGYRTPKITDFGLAKLLTTDSGHTVAGEFLGTPSYAAPEQASETNHPIGPPADLYALGSILYELLTGRPPFKGSTPLETLRQLVEQDPVPPQLLNPAVAPDLEAICLKCLEKYPARRYATATALAEDLARWQRHEPTHARPPGTVGRAIRWCRRHPAATIIAGVIFLGVLGVAWQWREAVAASALAEQRREQAEQAEQNARASSQTAQEQREQALVASRLAEQRQAEAVAARAAAEEDAAAAREVAEFLTGMFEEVDPLVISGRLLATPSSGNPSALDLVNRGAKQLSDPKFLQNRPLVRAKLLDRVGKVYLGLGEGARGIPLLAEALELRKKHLPADHPDVATSLQHVGFVELVKGRYGKATELIREALVLRQKLFGENDPLTISTLGYLGIAQAARRDANAEDTLTRAIAGQKALLAKIDPANSRALAQAALDTGILYLCLALKKVNSNDPLSAIAPIIDAQKLIQTIPDQDIIDIFNSIIGFFQAQALNQRELAEKTARRAIQSIEKRAGRGHFLSMRLQRALVNFTAANNRHDSTEALCLDIIDASQKALGPDCALEDVYENLAVAVIRGKLVPAKTPEEKKPHAERAAAYMKISVELARKQNDIGLLGHHATIAADYYAFFEPNPNLALAEEYAREGYRCRSEYHGAGHRLAAHPRETLVIVLTRQTKPNELEDLIRKLLEQDPQPNWHRGAGILKDAAAVLAEAKKLDAAMIYIGELVRVYKFPLAELQNDPRFATLLKHPPFQALRDKK